MSEENVRRFRDTGLGKKLVEKVRRATGDGPPVPFMEVCGTHTVAYMRSGIRDVLKDSVRLISGPGCPVCVTPNSIIDKAIAYGEEQDVIVTTFGDMLRVPGSRDSLENVKAAGGDIRVVYSPLDALVVAKKNPEKKVVFMGAGFETTTPTVAASIMKAKIENIKNFAVLCAHKTIPSALEALLSDENRVGIRGLICPGHVSAIIGADAYIPIATNFGIPCVVTGFEPIDIIHGLLMLLNQVNEGRAGVEIQYSRFVTKTGNRKACSLMATVFEECDTEWRGLGIIKNSGCGIRAEYSEFDAEKRWPVQTLPPVENPGCRCGEILTGKIAPSECPLFGKGCVPEKPVGPCMVSSEGTCAAHYKYGGVQI